jgi:hypothetical protein
MQNDGDLVGIGDDVIVGDDIAGRINDEAGAERSALARLSLRTPALGNAMLEKVAKELLEWGARRELRDLWPAMLAAAFRFHRLGRRNVDNRGQQLRREIGKTVGRRASLDRWHDGRRSGD